MALRSLVLVALGVVVAAGVVTAIADKGRKAGPSRTTTIASTSKRPVAPPPSNGPVVHVAMRDLAFSRSTITVKTGERIEWDNKDNVGHTVTSEADASGLSTTTFDSGTIQPGATFIFTPQRPGLVRYICTLHPTVMSGTIKVLRGQPARPRSSAG